MKKLYNIYYEDESYEFIDAEDALNLLTNFIINSNKDGYHCDISAESIYWLNKDIKIHEIYIDPIRE